MKNIQCSTAKTKEGTILTLKINLNQDFGLSKSGKTIIVASSEGNKPIPTMEGYPFRMGLNIYKNKDA
jgi:hypothetical protein